MINSPNIIWKPWRFALSLTLALAGYATPGAESFSIKFEFASKVGQKYHLRAHGSTKGRTITSAGSKTNGIVIDFNGEVEVLQVDSKGHETKIACTVEKCLVESGEKKRALFGKGDTIVLQEENRRQRFSVNGVEVTPETAAALRIVLSIHTREADDDDIFGTKDLKKVGDNWPVNSATAAADFRQTGSPIVPRDLEGTCQLNGVKIINGEHYLDVSATMKTKNIDFPAGQGIKVREAAIEGRFSGLFSVNHSRRPAKESISLKAMLKMDREPSDGAGSAELSFEQAVERELGN